MQEKLKQQQQSLHIQTFYYTIFVQHILLSVCTRAATPIRIMQRPSSSTCEGENQRVRFMEKPQQANCFNQAI